MARQPWTYQVQLQKKQIMKLEDFPEEDQEKIIAQSNLPGVGKLKAKLWALVGGPNLSVKETEFLIRSVPHWAYEDELLVASIKKALEWDQFLLKVNAERSVS
jgi:hypothetical protein